MAGTDRSKRLAAGGPAVVLVRPQLAENLGTTARAMANFGLSELRLVAPRPRLRDAKARAAASGASPILEAAAVFETVEAAVADLGFVYATTARERGQAKPVDPPDRAAALLRARMAAGERAGVLFGPERTGLDNDEIALADRVLTFPVDPGFASVNLAQAVLLVGYEWFKTAPDTPLPFDMRPRAPLAEKRHLVAFFAHLEGALDRAGFFRPASKRPIMIRNLRNIFHRLELTQGDLRTLHGVIDMLAEPRIEGVRRGRRVLMSPTGEEDGAGEP